MNGKKGSHTIQINISSFDTNKSRMKEKKPMLSMFKDWLWEVWIFCKEDSNRVKFAFKVGLAVLLVSLLILFRRPYQIFGSNIIWSILTVAIMFEYTVGSTFNRGFNRALGSLVAGILAITVAQLAVKTGRVVQPYIIGSSIFLVGFVTSFMKLWPSLVQYEYGFRVILFTFCLIIVSGYRMGNPIVVSMDRLYSIAIGGIIAVVVNVVVFPIWAGDQLHKELVDTFNSVAESLEECVNKYLDEEDLEHQEFAKMVTDDFLDEPAYKKCRATLNSSAKLETLANAAKWEPPHGRFNLFFYPWGEYVKVGAVVRYCAYEVMALHGVLHSEIQAPYNLRMAFRSEILGATSQAAELVKTLGKDINNMKQTLKASLLKRVHSSTEQLQQAIDIHSYLLTTTTNHDETPSLDYTSKIFHSLLPSTLNDNTLNEQIEFNVDNNNTSKQKDPESRTVLNEKTETYHEMMRKQNSRKLHSWPSREVDVFEDVCLDGEFVVPRMKALESTAALSLATFTSLLIEFVARLDHLVEAVDELSKLAKFKHEAL